MYLPLPEPEVALFRAQLGKSLGNVATARQIAVSKRIPNFHLTFLGQDSNTRNILASFIAKESFHLMKAKFFHRIRNNRATNDAQAKRAATKINK